MAREAVMLVVESAYGTPKTTPTMGTDALIIRCDGSNGFTPRMNPLMFEIMHGGGVATPALTGSDVVEVKGTLQTKLYASQASLLLGWCAIPINGAQTSPWTTTEPAGDLASMSLYHAKTRSDGTTQKKRYAGAKVASWKLTGSRDAKIWDLSIDIIAQKVVGNAYDSSTDPTTEFVFPPVETNYPTDPYTFTNASGGLTLNNTSRTMFSSVGLSATNVLDGRPFENRFIQLVRFLGRKTYLEAKLALKAAPDDRAVYEAVTANVCSFVLSNGTHSATITLNGNNVYEEDTDDLPVDKIYEYTLKIKNQYDQAAGTPGDLALAFT